MPKARTSSETGIQKLLYSREEAAFALGISTREIDRLISGRDLSTRPYKRRRLIPAEDVLRVRDAILNTNKYAA